MSRKTILFLVVILGNIFGLSGFAQKSAPSGLALEINSINGKPPAYLTISTSSAEAKWSWIILFNRIPNFKNSADRLPVRAVKFLPYIENDSVKINVGVFTGIRFLENEETVKVYSARENERIMLEELTAFGVEPFEIAVIRTVPSISLLPSVINKTKSLQVNSIEPNFSTLPSYKIKVLNTSEKAVAAFTFEAEVEGKRQLSGMPQGEKGQPLIKTGETFERDIPNVLFENQKAFGEQIPAVKPDQVFIVSSVVFEDGSYEGDTQRAAPLRAYLLGRKLQLKRIISFIQVAEDEGEKLDVNNFAEQAAKLEVSINETEIKELLKDFPALTEREKLSLRNAGEISSDRVKREFVKNLEMQLRKSTSDSIFTWLKLTKEQYQNWLKGLP